jgi:hypothetical protein
MKILNLPKERYIGIKRASKDDPGWSIDGHRIYVAVLRPKTIGTLGMIVGNWAVIYGQRP